MLFNAYNAGDEQAEARSIRVTRWAFQRVAKPIHLGIRRAGSLAVDRFLGIVTTDERVASILGVERGFYLSTYRAGGWPGIWRMLRLIDPQGREVLLDIGCGAGRVVCLAARMPWRGIIGLDISPEFARLAQENASNLRGRRTEVTIVQTDATQFVVPDEVTIVFLYNPFRGDPMRQTLSRVLESVDREPRRVRIFYGNPHDHQLLLEMGRFRPTDRIRLGWRPGEEWARSLIVQVYEVQPAA